MAKITVEPSGRVFFCEGRQSILEAALASSVALNYGCSAGTCGLCVGRLKAGRIAKVSHHDFPMKEANRLQGDFLLCAYTAASPEVVIEATEAAAATDIPWQRIEARIRRLRRVTERVAIVSVQTPRTSRLRFLPGQNVRLTLAAGRSAELAVASCPCDDRNIEFHLRQEFTEGFYSALMAAPSCPMPVTIEGPWGATPGDAARGLSLCLAYDTGVAPLVSWIEQQLTDDPDQTIALRWYAGSETDFYLRNLLRSWQDAFDSFDLRLAVCAGPGEVPRTALNGLADQASGGQWNDTRVLVSGPAPFVERLQWMLRESGFPESATYRHSTSGPA